MSEATPSPSTAEHNPGRPPVEVEKALNEGAETFGKIDASRNAIRAEIMAFVGPVIVQILALKDAADQAGQIRALHDARRGLSELIDGPNGLREQLLAEYRGLIPHPHELNWVIQRMIAPIQVDAGERLGRASHMKPEHFQEFYSPAPAGGVRRYGKKEEKGEVKEGVMGPA